MNPIVVRIFGLDSARTNVYRALIRHGYRRVGCFGLSQLIVLMHAALQLYARPIPGEAGDYLHRLAMPLMGSFLIMVWFYSSFRVPEVGRVLRTLPVTQAEMNRIGWAHVLIYFPLIWLPFLALLATILVWMPTAGIGAVVLNLTYCVLFFGIMFGYRWIGFAVAAFFVAFWMPQELGQLNAFHAMAILAAAGAIVRAIQRNLPAQSELMRSNAPDEPRQRWRSVAEVPKAYPSLLYLNSRGLIRAIGAGVVICPIYVGTIGFAVWSSAKPYAEKLIWLEDYAVHAAVVLFVMIAIGANSHRERLSVYRSLPVSVNQLAIAFWLPCVALACMASLFVSLIVRGAGNAVPGNVTPFDAIQLSGLAALLSLDNVLPTRKVWVLARLLVVPLLILYASLAWLGPLAQVIAGVASIYAAHHALVAVLQSSSVMYREIVPEDGAKLDVAQFFGDEFI